MTIQTATNNSQQMPLTQLPGLENLKTDTALDIGTDPNNIYIPKKNADHIFNQEKLFTFLDWLYSDSTDGYYLYGPWGCGKSSEIKQFHAYYQLPLICVTGHEDLEFLDMAGRNIALKGSIFYEHGPLSLAMMHGIPLMIDELDRCSQEFTVALNSILDGDPLVIAENGGEVIKPKPGFKIIATGNSNGAADTKSVCHTVKRLDPSTLDRFEIHSDSYPSRDIEATILKRSFPDVDDSSIEPLLELSERIRILYLNEKDDDLGISAHQIEKPMTMRCYKRYFRKLKTFAHRTDKSPYYFALNAAYANGLSESSRNAVQQLAAAIFGVDGNDPS